MNASLWKTATFPQKKQNKKKPPNKQKQHKKTKHTHKITIKTNANKICKLNTERLN